MKIFCVGRNYSAHAAELGNDIPDEPIIFASNTPWEKAKAWDNSAIIGKWLPLTNLKNKKDINFCLYKNKELVQQGNSSNMIHNFDTLVAYISNYFSVNIGDVIFTGTPAGVGEVVVGDELEGFIEDDSMFTLEVK
jgi:2-keto-4-pentenoate hydratase/2-oxohepta-3-ene-1,7-dioic acid hydratase in catechol pathway